jgi:TonB family protein
MNNPADDKRHSGGTGDANDARAETAFWNENPGTGKVLMATALLALIGTLVLASNVFDISMTRHETDTVASTETEEPHEIYSVVEAMPELVGGLDSIRRNIQYPDVAKKAGIEGRVIVQFIVDENGTVQSPVTVRGIGGGCDEEALRVVTASQWTPGKQRGRNVNVKMAIPIHFKLE